MHELFSLSQQSVGTWLSLCVQISLISHSHTASGSTKTCAQLCRSVGHFCERTWLKEAVRYLLVSSFLDSEENLASFP